LANEDGGNQPDSPGDRPKPNRIARRVSEFKRYRDKRRAEKYHESATDKASRSTSRATWAIAVFTLATIGVGISQYIIFSRQLNEMRATREEGDRSFAAQLAVMQTQADAMQGQLRMLQQQVIDAREMQRAFITASDYKITKIVGGDPNQSCWRFQPIISNAGGSPTVELRYVIQVVFVALRRPGEQGSAWGLILAPTDPDAVFQRSGGWDGALLGPKQNLPDTPANDRVCLTKDDSPYIFAPQRVYARGAIHYHDRYPGTPEHITKYCFWIRAIEDGGGWKPEPALCSHWNCADEECKRDEDAYADEVAETFKNAGQTPEPPAEFFPQ
jgi:hypothetical protein